MNELSIEQRIKNIQQSTLAELDTNIDELLATKRNRALAVGFVLGSLAAVALNRFPIGALAGGLAVSLVSGRLAYRYLL